jgi:Holliday junction resolvase-like predicted endonuclease
MRWTPEQLAEFEARRKITSEVDVANDPAPESQLERKIEQWLTEHGIAWIHDRSRGANRPGQPDIIAAMPHGATLWLELKSAQGRLSAEQKTFRLLLLQRDHLWYEVRSFRAFLEIAGPMVERMENDAGGSNS